MEITNDGVRHNDWHATWLEARRGVRGATVRVLNPRDTGGNVLSEADVRFAIASGYFPSPMGMVVLSSWGTPFPINLVINRRDFDDWIRGSGKPGRNLHLSYDDIIKVRRAAKYSSPSLDGLRWHMKRAAYHHIRSGLTYWWVEGTNPDWIGYSWRW